MQKTSDVVRALVLRSCRKLEIIRNNCWVLMDTVHLDTTGYSQLWSECLRFSQALQHGLYIGSFVVKKINQSFALEHRCVRLTWPCRVLYRSNRLTNAGKHYLWKSDDSETVKPDLKITSSQRRKPTAFLWPKEETLQRDAAPRKISGTRTRPQHLYKMMQVLDLPQTM